jgi:hypothetical protein
VSAEVVAGVINRVTQSDQRGFTLVEFTVAAALTLALTAAIFSITQASRRAADVQSEVADVQQRGRVAVDTLMRDLMMAGAGPYLAGHAGPLTASIPGLMPFRRGMSGNDLPGSFRSDAVTALFVPTTAAQTTLTAAAAAGSTTLQVAALPTCAAGVNLCAFLPGTTVMAYDAAGAFQIFTVSAVVDGFAQIITTTPASRLFAEGSPVVEVEVHSYTLKNDPSTRLSQLMTYDGTANGDLPVLDHVVALAFDYDVPAAELMDGPWRPDAASEDRWDADLLRIRTVGVTIRVEAGSPALRGPAGVLFANAGTARNPRVWVPDVELRFQVSPRNLSLRR